MLENACPKPLRGTQVLEKEAEDAAYLALERKVKATVKKRDVSCRWPEAHICRKGLECAHVYRKDLSLGGGMSADVLVLLCGWLHRRGPVSVHGKQLRIEALTAAGSDGALAFYRQGDDGTYYMVAQEIRPGQIERD